MILSIMLAAAAQMNPAAGAPAASVSKLSSAPCHSSFCTLGEGPDAERLNNAYLSDATTDAERAEMDRIIAANTTAGKTDWLAAARQYFAWRNGGATNPWGSPLAGIAVGTPVDEALARLNGVHLRARLKNDTIKVGYVSIAGVGFSADITLYKNMVSTIQLTKPIGCGVSADAYSQLKRFLTSQYGAPSKERSLRQVNESTENPVYQQYALFESGNVKVELLDAQLISTYSRCGVEEGFTIRYYEL
jgi:hypothetical protein